MNYYPHHIGDFNSATRHLTRIERSVYRDLLDLYYDTEHPVVKDMDKLCRLIIARSNEERTAVEQVLNEFFTETDNGWFHDRCDEEISKYRAGLQAKSAAGKASAAKRLVKTQQNTNGEATGVERTLNISSADDGTSLKRCSSSVENSLTLRSTNQNHNQEPYIKPLSGKPDGAVGESPPKDTTAREAIDYLNTKTGAHYRDVEANLKFVRARLAEGATLDEIKSVIDMKVRDWGGTESAKYLRPETLFNATKYNQYAGQIGGLRPTGSKPRELVV